MTDEIAVRRHGLRWRWRVVCWVSGRRRIDSGAAWRWRTAFRRAQMARTRLRSKRSIMLWPDDGKWRDVAEATTDDPESGPEVDIIEWWVQPPANGVVHVHYRPPGRFVHD